MSYTQRILPRLILFASIPIFCVGMVCLFGLVYTTSQLRLASARGVYPSAEAGMHALIERSFRQPDKVQIIYAGTNSFDGSSPHVSLSGGTSLLEGRAPRPAPGSAGPGRRPGGAPGPGKSRRCS